MKKTYVINIKGDLFPASKREVQNFINETDFSDDEKKMLIRFIEKGKTVNFGRNEKDKKKGKSSISIFKFNI